MNKLADYIDESLLTFDDIVRKINNGEHFTFSRFGDGEFNAISQKEGANCDGHKYYPEMGRELEKIVKSQPDYYIGIPLSERPWAKEIVQWLDKHTPDRKYTRSDLFHLALVEGKMQAFFDAVNQSGKRVILIGNKHLISSSNPIEFDVFIKVSATDAYKDLWKVGGVAPALNIENDIILFCAGMTSCIWIDFYYKSIFRDVTLIDLGCALDPFVGRQTRGFFKKMK